MSNNSFRKEVLKTFKNLHRATSSVLKNKALLKSAKKEINDTYRKNQNITDSDTIVKLNNHAKDVAYEIKTSVAELEETSPGVFRLKLRPEMFEEHKKDL